MKLSIMTKDLVRTLKKHSPGILTGIGIAGMLVTTIMAVEATPKAIKLIEDKKEEQEVEKLTAVETVKATWKCYIPAAIAGATSIACLIGANSVHVRRHAALVTACTLSETALREYKDKVVETFGEKKEQVVRDAIAKDKVDKHPVHDNEVVITNKGNTLCYDAISGRYFYSDIDMIQKSINTLNRQMLSDGFVILNDLYYELGLDDNKIGSSLGWNVDHGLIELRFSSQLTANGEPCLVLDFVNPPIYSY